MQGVVGFIVIEGERPGPAGLKKAFFRILNFCAYASLGLRPPIAAFISRVAPEGVHAFGDRAHMQVAAQTGGLATLVVPMSGD